MDKKISVFYTIFSVLFLVVLLGLFVGKIAALRNEQMSAARSHFSTTQQLIVRTYENGGRFSTPSFRDNIQNLFLSGQSIEAILVYSYDTGLEYLFSRESSNLVQPVVPASVPQPVPRFRYNRLTQEKLHLPLNLPHRTGMVMEGVYTLLSKRQIYPLLRDTLFVLAAFILLSGIVLTVLSLIRNRYADDFSSDSVTARVPSTEPGSSEQSDTHGGLFSRRSGLGWEAHMRDRLTFELERSASFDQDLVLCLFYCSGSIPEEGYRLLGQELMDFFAFRDLSFEYGTSGFAVILPSTSLDQGIAKAEEFFDRIENQKRKRPELTECRLHAGLSARNGRLLEGERLLREADRALEKASRGKPGSIVGFRPDPSRYRKVVLEQQERD